MSSSSSSSSISVLHFLHWLLVCFLLDLFFFIVPLFVLLVPTFLSLFSSLFFGTSEPFPSDILSLEGSSIFELSDFFVSLPAVSDCVEGIVDDVLPEGIGGPEGFPTGGGLFTGGGLLGFIDKTLMAFQTICRKQRLINVYNFPIFG